MFPRWVRLVVLVFVLVASGCATNQRLAPVLSVHSKHNINHDVYTVQKDDTLSSIAWGLGLDIHDLARWNRLKPPYKLQPGMRLHLASTGVSVGGERVRVVSPHRVDPVANVHRGKKPSPIKLAWHWPARGSDVRFYKNNAGQIDALDISGHNSSSIVAAATREVVYSGTNARGYGTLVIVKHASGILSVYEFSSPSLVVVGQRVSAGELLAKIREGDRSDKSVLHFEIRQNGRAVNPLSYLPDHA